MVMREEHFSYKKCDYFTEFESYSFHNYCLKKYHFGQNYNYYNYYNYYN